MSECVSTCVCVEGRFHGSLRSQSFEVSPQLEDEGSVDGCKHHGRAREREREREKWLPWRQWVWVCVCESPVLDVSEPVLQPIW